MRSQNLLVDIRCHVKKLFCANFDENCVTVLDLQGLLVQEVKYPLFTAPSKENCGSSDSILAENEQANSVCAS